MCIRDRLCGEEAAGAERLVERLGWQLRKHPCSAGARRREAVAAAHGRGGLARGTRGEVGLRGSERTEHGEEHSNEFSPQKGEPILVQTGFSSKGLGSTAEGG